MQDLVSLKGRLRLPAIAAPMFLVSGPELVLAACKAGIVGSFPANNARTIEVLDQWLTDIKAAVGDAPWAINIMVHRTYERMAEELELVMKHKPPIVITALGSPRELVAEVQAYGGKVLADVNSLSYAKKAAEAGVDGLVLISAGAGGHTGQLSAFAFVPAVREFFDGIIVLGGAIGSGSAIRAAEILIASEESMAHPDYKTMLVEASADEIILSASLTGVPANWLKPSLVAAGFDPSKMGPKADIDLGRPEDNDAKRWKDVWSAGQGVGAVRAIEQVGAIVDQLAGEYAAAKARN
jgi:nitronate monooxygenase